MVRSALQFLIIVIFLSGCESLIRLIESERDGALTEEEVIRGLRQALELGAGYAGDQASGEDGFFGDPRLYIPFPEQVSRAESTLRDLGLDNLVDDFILRLNRAAELAAAEAAPIFIDAIREITIQDGFEILRGAEDAATRFLYERTAGQLESAFRPVIENALDQTHTTRYWEDVVGRYNQLPFTENIDTDLAGYTTRRAIDGLFVLIEEEEAEFRHNPASRTTELLRRVFGSQDTQQQA